MGLKGSKRNLGTEKQPLNYTSIPPDVCLIPAPPPPTGPQGIPTPFPILTTTKKVVKSGAAKVVHKGKKVVHTKTVYDGIKGNEAGVGQLPPGTPKKDVITMVNMKNGKPITGNSSVKMGGKPTSFVTSQAFGNIK